MRAGAGSFFVATAAITTLVVVACATGTGSSGTLDEAGIIEDASRDLNVLPKKDSGTPLEDTGVPPEEDSGGGCTQKVVINEVMTNGPNGSEFVELYNPNTCAVPLGGWRVAYKADNNNPGGASYTFATGDSILAKSFLVVATATFTGKKDATFNGGFANGGGQVGLLDDTKATIDGVGYGTGTSGDYTEGTPVAAPATNGSVGRTSDGVDTGNNKSDFAAFATPTPGTAN